MIVLDVEGLTLVIKNADDWYVRVRTKLYDNRHNNEFLIFDGKFINVYIDDLKKAWNFAADRMNQIIQDNYDYFQNVANQMSEKEDLEEEDGLNLGDEEYDSEGGLGILLQPSSLSATDIIDFDPNDEFAYCRFTGIVNIFYQGLYNADFTLDNQQQISIFINRLEKCYFTAQKIISEVIPVIEKAVEQQEFNSLCTIIENENFSPIARDESLINFRKKNTVPRIKQEHGATYF